MHAALPLVKVLGAFTLILVLYRLKLPLAAAILVGAGAMGVAFGLPVDRLAMAALYGAVKPDTIGLGAVTILLLLLSKLMEEAGQLARIVRHGHRLLRRPIASLVAMPALVGLLPMPGGALFSAPMVRHSVGDTPVSAGRLSAINYWFRHVWEYWWPLFPGVLLAISITKASPGALILVNMPLTVLMLSSGLAFLFRGVHRDLTSKAAPAQPGTLRALVRETSSIWLVIVVFAPLAIAIQAVPDHVIAPEARRIAGRYGPIAAGLVASLAWTVRLNRLSLRTVWRALADRKLYAMLLLIVGIMVFQNMLDRTEAPKAIVKGFGELGVPAMAAVVILPFVSGLVTGVAIGFVGAAFPIIVPLLAAEGARPGSLDLLSYMALAYGIGHIGQMLSPIHFCQVVSNRYFETSYGPVYRWIVPAAVLTIVLEVGYFVVLRLLLVGG